MDKFIIYRISSTKYGITIRIIISTSRNKFSEINGQTHPRDTCYTLILQFYNYFEDTVTSAWNIR